VPAISCPSYGNTYIANLQTRVVTTPAPSACNNGASVDATGDGNFVVIGGAPCVYSVQNSSYTVGPLSPPKVQMVSPCLRMATLLVGMRSCLI